MSFMNTPPNRPPRWYDAYPNLFIIFEMTEKLPRRFQEQVGDALIEVLQRHEKLNPGTPLKNVGAGAVMNLYKTKKKQRWYDHIPQLHKAYTQLVVMPEETLYQINEKCVEIVTYIKRQQAPAYRPPPPVQHPPQPQQQQQQARQYPPQPANPALRKVMGVEIREQDGYLVQQQKEQQK